MQAIDNYQNLQCPSLGSNICVNGHEWDHYYSNSEQSSIASVKTYGLWAIIEIRSWCIYTWLVLNRWIIELDRTSCYMKYNTLLQQWQWPITDNKTHIWRVNKLACLFGKNDCEVRLMNISNSWHNIGNGTIWTGLRMRFRVDVAFYLEFNKKIIKQVYLPKAKGPVAWILYPLLVCYAMCL